MDKSVIDAMARWPDVPDVYGWLSLSERGQWRLHPQGDALDDPSNSGEAISSTTILSFIARNFAVDKRGQWYFQNGPQRVYIRIDGAPYILHALTTPQGNLALHTHTGLPARQIFAWILASDGRLYAQTSLGPGLVQGRDLEAVLSHLKTHEDTSVLDFLADQPDWRGEVRLAPLANTDAVDADHAMVFRSCPCDDIPDTLGYVRLPHAEIS